MFTSHFLNYVEVHVEITPPPVIACVAHIADNTRNRMLGGRQHQLFKQHSLSGRIVSLGSFHAVCAETEVHALQTISRTELPEKDTEGAA